MLSTVEDIQEGVNISKETSKIMKIMDAYNC